MSLVSPERGPQDRETSSFAFSSALLELPRVELPVSLVTLSCESLEIIPLANNLS